MEHAVFSLVFVWVFSVTLVKTENILGRLAFSGKCRCKIVTALKFKQVYSSRYVRNLVLNKPTFHFHSLHLSLWFGEALPSASNYKHLHTFSWNHILKHLVLKDLWNWISLVGSSFILQIICSMVYCDEVTRTNFRAEGIRWRQVHLFTVLHQWVTTKEGSGKVEDCCLS